MISLKKYLDADRAASVLIEPDSTAMFATTMDSYRSALRAIGKSAVEAFPAPGHDLEQGLASIEHSLSLATTAQVMRETQVQVEDRLQQWGRLTAKHLQGNADDVKELLLLMARTAESVGERDKSYANKFGDLTANLRAIANLDDITQIRSSLARKATELKHCIDQMTQDGQHSLAQLRSKVLLYETKLKEVEKIALKDALTGLANRRNVEGRMEWHIAQNQSYCVVILDLNRFKQVNDKYGHGAGDDLLRKFSHELQDNVRSADLVGRWGGDEFILVLGRDLAGAKAQIDRMRKWVFGDYIIQAGTGKQAVKVHVDFSVGLAQWMPGDTMQHVIEQADAAMYLDKHDSPNHGGLRGALPGLRRRKDQVRIRPAE